VDDGAAISDGRSMMAPVTPTTAREVEPRGASPMARRVQHRAWRDPRLVVGVLLVAISGLLGAVLLDQDQEPALVWAAAGPLVAGQHVAAGDLVAREVRFADGQAAGRYLDAGADPPADAVLAREVGAGELLPVAALARATERLTEVPLSVPADALPATVRVGGVVDVWVAPDLVSQPLQGAPPDAQLVFRRVPVLALGRPGSSLGPSANRQVIVGLDDGAARDLPGALTALTSGTVVVTRHP
jgi:hypothetical protein